MLNKRELAQSLLAAATARLDRFTPEAAMRQWQELIEQKAPAR
jgi:hypothetical protein